MFYNFIDTSFIGLLAESYLWRQHLSRGITITLSFDKVLNTWNDTLATITRLLSIALRCLTVVSLSFAQRTTTGSPRSLYSSTFNLHQEKFQGTSRNHFQYERGSQRHISFTRKKETLLQCLPFICGQELFKKDKHANYLRVWLDNPIQRYEWITIFLITRYLGLKGFPRI